MADLSASPPPLAFRIGVPGADTLDDRGIRSVGYRLEGLLRLVDATLVFEWAATRTTESVSFAGVKTETDRSPIGALEVPVERITTVRRRGGWWAPRLELRASEIDAFDALPGARPASIRLKIRRRDRAHADAMALAIDLALADGRLEHGEGIGGLGEGNAPQIGDTGA